MMFPTDAFYEIQFPPDISYGSGGGPGFKTSIFSVDSGYESATADWDVLRARYTVDFDLKPIEDVRAVEEFFYAMRGKLIGFRFKDWNDYQIVSAHLGLGDGVTTAFQLCKRYQSGAHVYDRVIKKPVVGSIPAGAVTVNGVAQVEGVDFTLISEHGIIDFTTAPAVGDTCEISYCEFDVPVRFDSDELIVSYDEFQQLTISSLDFIEILQ